MKKILLIILLIPSILFAHDTDKTACDVPPVEEKKTSFWEKSLALGFSLTDGNSDTTLFTSELKAKHEKDKDTFKLDAAYNFGENDNETNVDNATAGASYQRLLTERSYVGLGADYLRNELSDVKYRATLNSLYGFHILKGESTDLSLEAGPSYVFEEVGNIDDNYLAFRVADSFEFRISETSKIFQESEILVQAEDSNNYLLNSKIGIEAKMTDALSLVSTLTSLYDNEPASGIKRHDLIAVTSLAYSF